jgi:hypothetical protein
MAMGSATASEATIRTSTRPKPFFSRTRLEAELEASGSCDDPGVRIPDADVVDERRNESRPQAVADHRRVAEGVIDADVAGRGADVGGVVGIVVAAIPLTPSDGPAVPLHHEDLGRLSGPDAQAQVLELLVERRTVEIPAGHVRFVQPGLDEGEVGLDHGAKGQARTGIGTDGDALSNHAASNHAALKPCGHQRRSECPDPAYGSRTSSPRSRAGLEWVSAPTATKCTPVAATSPTWSRRSPPLASKRTPG